MAETEMKLPLRTPERVIDASERSMNIMWVQFVIAILLYGVGFAVLTNVEIFLTGMIVAITAPIYPCVSIIRKARKE